MTTFRLLTVAALVLTAAVVVTGCGEQPANQKSTGPMTKHSPAAAPDDAIAANMAKLSDADREIAEKQKICPVSGEKLGAMGTPVKVTVKDTDVFICCDACRKDLEKSPDEYLAKLNKAEE